MLVNMIPLKFPYANLLSEKPGELPLPAWSDGMTTISCWGLSWRERIHVLLSGMLWIRQKNLRYPLQALRPQAPNPFPKMPLVENDNTRKPIAKPGEPFVESNCERPGGRPDLM